MPREFIALYCNMVEELRSMMNRKITETMQPIEERDARFFERQRLKWESRPYPRVSKKSR